MNKIIIVRNTRRMNWDLIPDYVRHHLSKDNDVVVEPYNIKINHKIHTQEYNGFKPKISLYMHKGVVKQVDINPENYKTVGIFIIFKNNISYEEALKQVREVFISLSSYNYETGLYDIRIGDKKWLT
jgi:hypothetical protein